MFQQHALLLSLALITLLLAACGPSPQDLAMEPVTNDHGQTMTYVSAGTLPTWMRTHRHDRIVALTGFSMGEGGTTGYVVIYEASREPVELSPAAAQRALSVDRAPGQSTPR